MDTLRYGSRGTAVQYLQLALQRAGFSIALDGIFGARTLDAVRSFQRDLGLEKVADAADLIPLGMPPTPHTPRKDTWYLRRRYFHYPHFHYDVWAARENGKLLAYLVTRTVTAQDTGCAAVVRLVDFIGEDTVLPRLGGAIDAIVRRAGAEYIDCYNAGIPAAVWQAAGFTERVEGDGCIIPNYLTPPLRENTEYYYFTNKPENFVLFKADGDQDRPNLT